ncbi:4'-phosphopantetheinyl transferase superfamily protein [Pseudoalteromonas sp. OOF1S-7]|uniref:4'-phosphopantetheinyl transferase family protein n=1 Tax=Pseudoalteromonas sp. OOF1S-7 TaxID=2917757 RepID=UPI001EF6B83B|nr:4'-phosphopantetheinyl transferase superfamily protein [Pseudoalteromonas sp. OOF1S-7]MCG7534474.1 4'-phosphopantetheinyl transferase superfamily protein [Pseudoalteromonas sp. OOF1S-7]
MISDTVHVWICDLKHRRLALQGEPDPLKILNQAELNHYSSLGDEAQKIAYLYSRVMLQRLLTDCFIGSNRNISVSKNANGKPVLLGPEKDIENLHISISYTEHWVAVALGKVAAMGIDIECIDQLFATKEIAQRFFHKNEVSDLSRHHTTYPFRFAQFWTLKEAFLKCTGTGLDMPLDSIEFALDAKQIVYKIHDRQYDGQYQFSQYLLNNEVCLSVCTSPMGGDKVTLRVSAFPTDTTDTPGLCTQLGDC